MELNIVMFDESKAKFVEIVSKYKSLDRDIESVADYHIVSTARKELARYRIDFEKNCKAIRDEATKFNRSVRDKELEALAEVEPVEEALKSREQKFKLKKEMENRRELLPSRISKLETIGITMSDDDILRMDDKQFD
jgi:flagellar motility protein MotE (MotC chaperone)